MTDTKVTQDQTENAVVHNNIKHKIMVLSGKGGVGKSTVAVNLAYGLHSLGKSVGLLDADIHGPSIAKMTGSEGIRAMASMDGNILPVLLEPNLKALSIAYLIENPDAALIWRGPMKMGALKDMIQKTEWGDLEYLVIDCPPGTGDEPLSVAQLLGNVDGAIIVSSAQDVAIIDVRKSLDFIHQMNIPVLGLIENMSYIECPHCGQKIEMFVGEGIDRAIMDYHINLLAKLPFDHDITHSCDKGEPFILQLAKTASGKILHEFVQSIVKAVD